MLKKLFSIFCITFSAFSFSFASRVISPVSGNFNNKQSLVIDTSDGVECYYSFSGTDPLTSGFAYDGPVLIDCVGRINVKITVVKDEVRQEDIEINYNVQEHNPFERDSAEDLFIKNTVNSGFYSYSFDSPVSIPNSFAYCMGDGEKPYLQGKELSLDLSNRLSRYIPCNITDGKNSWRFVIFVAGGETGTLSKFSVPFKIEDWTTFIFTGEKLIYQIDGQDWSASTLPVTLDRKVRHVISWQSVAYEKGNPISSFILPPEPKLNIRSSGNGPAVFSIDGDLRYRMGIVSSGVSGVAEESNGLFTQAVFDTFEGDEIKGEAVFAFYCDGVFQGYKRSYYSVDKMPPMPPKFIPSNNQFYARGEVNVDIKAETDSKIFYAVSPAFKVSEEKIENNSAELDGVEAGNFKPFSASIRLGNQSESAVFYKVKAYAVDQAENVSSVAEYRVIIDEFNYYLDASAKSALSDGSRAHPFNSFDQALQVINSARFAHFYVTGTFTLPEEEVSIGSNCSFTSVTGGKIIVPANGSIIVRSASFSAENIIFEKNRSASAASSGKLFELENSTMALTNCEVAGIFEENGTAVSAINSVLELTDSGLTVQSYSYGAGISSIDSKISVKNSRLSCISDTAVVFSVTGGIFELKNSQCKVISHLGRIAELARTNARLLSNNYEGQFDKKVRGIVPVWKDKDTLLLEDKNNNSSGF